jgi:hypothetical protein
MNGLKLFWNFLKDAVSEILANKKTYLGAFVSLLLLSNVESLYPLLGVSEDSGLFIFMTILSTLVVFIVLSQIVLVQKKKHGGAGELGFFVPTFLLYNLYYSFVFFLGLILLIVPGFYGLIYFSMVPFIAVLDDDAQDGFFKKSRELVRKNVGLVAWASVINLFMECSALLFTPIKNPLIKSVANFAFSIPDSFLTIAMTIATVKIYYYLKNS